MMELRAPLRTLGIFTMVVLITAAISLITSASTETGELTEGDEQLLNRFAERLSVMKEPEGVLTVLGGSVMVNGNNAKTGLTILSGSKITTSSNGKAVIDLDSLGRIQVGNDTTIYLTLLPVMVFVKSTCDETQITVTRGQVDVQSPKKESIPVGKAPVYKAPFEAMTNGGTNFVITCHGRKVALVPVTGAQGLWGLLALLGKEVPAVLETAPVFSIYVP